MLFSPRALVFLAACAAGACTTTQDPGYSSTPRRTDQGSFGRWGERIVVETSAIPAAWLWIDNDGDTPRLDPEYAAGYSVRAASGDFDQSVGLQYQGLFADDADFDVSVLSLDVQARTPLDGSPHRLYVHAGGGFGWSWIDDPVDGSVRSDAQAQLRIGLEYQAAPTVAITASAGGVFFGHPGETEGWGTFFTLGAVFAF